MAFLGRCNAWPHREILPMRNLFAVLALACCAAPPVSAQLEPAGRPFRDDSIRDIAIRNVTVARDGTVDLFCAFGDGQGRWSTRFSPDSLDIQVDGKALEGTARLGPFLDSNHGIAVLVAIDTSGSMKALLPGMKRALLAYVKTLRRNVDMMAVGVIGDDWHMVQDLTRNPDLTAKAITDIGGGSLTTALFESIYEGIDLLRKRGTDVPARRFIVVLSDGVNEKRGRTAGECIESATRGHIQIHAFILEAKRTVDAVSARGELQKIARDTGGISFVTRQVDDLDEAFARLRNTLASEFVLHIPGALLPRDGKKHRVTVSSGTISDSIRYKDTRGDAALQDLPPNRDSDDFVPMEDDAPSGRKMDPVFQVGIAFLVAGLALGAGGFIRSRRKARALPPGEVGEEPIGDLPEPGATRTIAGEEPGETERQVSAEPPLPSSGDMAGGPGREEADRGTKTTQPGDRQQEEPGRKTAFLGAGPLPVTGLRVLRGGPGSGRFPLTPGTHRVGYGEKNDIVVEDDSISSSHAEIRLDAAGCYVRDLGSTNGTYVNGTRVGERPHPLHPGSKLQLGVVVMVCE